MSVDAVQTENKDALGAYHNDPVALETDELRVEVHATGGPVRYTLSLRRDGSWVRLSEAPSRVVDGEFFDLRADSVRADENGAVLSGRTAFVTAHGDTTEYRWSLEVRLAERGWVEFTLRLVLPQPGMFNRSSGYEPALLFDLGPLPPYDRGHDFWARTELLGYTRFDHTPNNDLPALYYRDPQKRARLLMFFDTAAMSWMGPDTMARFRDYRLGLQEYGGRDRGHRVGLYGVSRSGTVWPAGESRIAYAIQVRDEPRQTNDREALADLVCNLGERVKGTPDVEYAPTWAELAVGAARDLGHDACWSRTPQGEWLRPYVNDWSPVWASVGAAEGRGNENLGGTPYMLWFQETVLSALEFGFRFTRLRGALQPARDRVLASSLGYYASVESVFDGYMSSNMTDDAVRGTWQYVHSVAAYWWSARALGLVEEARLAVDEVRAGVLPLLERHAFVPPTTHRRSDLEKVGPGVSFSVLGVCADLFARLAEDAAAGDRALWTGLALRSVRTLARAPEYAVHQESNHLGSAVHAASRLVRSLEGTDPGTAAELRSHATYLTHQALRQFYWCEETAYFDPDAPARVRGLSTCCTPMGYSAFWENIAQALLLSCSFATLDPDLTALRFLNVMRQHAKASLPAAVGDPRFERAFVPLEDLKLLEVSRDPSAGQEVYGAGHVVWAYALFEAFCETEAPNRELLVLSTGLLEAPEALEARRTFLICNLGARSWRASGHFDIPGFELTRWRVYSSSAAPLAGRRGEGRFDLELPANAWVKLEVEKGAS